MAHKIYVASSWRNEYQGAVVATLRDHGHEVYDFKNPAPGETGFSWSKIDPNWKNWTPEEFKAALKHPIAQKGFQRDQDALDWCSACVLLLPSGSSAHLEAGYTAGRGKATCVYVPGFREPELMYNTFQTLPLSRALETFCLTMDEVLKFLQGV